MLDLNIGNVLTVAIISIVAYAGVKAVCKAANISTAWL